MGPMDGTRIDSWLWAVRLCTTRSEATALCRGGHVRLGERPAKPASTLTVGDRIEAHIHDRDRVVIVTRLISKRVGAPIAVECYEDHSPVRDDERDVPLLERDRGAGRPTKRDRRQIEAWRDRSR
jgi:ribosome-associated heat shock protein Hsp15